MLEKDKLEKNRSNEKLPGFIWNEDDIRIMAVFGAVILAVLKFELIIWYLIKSYLFIVSFRNFEKLGMDYLKKVKPMLSDLNTYLSKVHLIETIRYRFW